LLSPPFIHKVSKEVGSLGGFENLLNSFPIDKTSGASRPFERKAYRSFYPLFSFNTS